MKLIKDLFKKNGLSEILSIFVSSRLLIFFTGYLSNLIIVKNRWYAMPTSFLDLFFKWDSGWYWRIMKDGYNYIPGRESNIAFFPLYPMLVRFFSAIFGNPALTGFIISNIALLFAAIYLYKLIMLDYGDTKIASRAVFYMLIFPASFFFSIFYTEGLFLFLSISSYYYARRKQWLAASMLGLFLSLTKCVGVAIIIPFLIEYLDIDFKSFRIDFRKIKKDILYLFLIPAGSFTYLFYLYIKFNDAFVYFHVQSAGWGRGFTSIFKTLSSVRNYYIFYQIIFMGAVVFALFFILYLIYSKARISYIVYAALFLFLYLSGGVLEAMYRYISVLFPIYLGMSILANKNRFLDYSLTSFSIMLLTLFTILFVNGYWMT